MILIIGGSGSGKSAYAEQRILEYENEKRYYLATMQAAGEEGRTRVAHHRQMRAGKGFETVEQPKDIQMVLEKTEPQGAAALLECVSNLTANEMFDGAAILPEEAVVKKITAQILALDAAFDKLVVVTNNVFEDGVPYGETTLAYIRALGAVNRRLAEASREVVEVAAGIPVCLKREEAACLS